jgi:hypothetical protein
VQLRCSHADPAAEARTAAPFQACIATVPDPDHLRSLRDRRRLGGATQTETLAMPTVYGSKFNAMKHADMPNPSPRFFMFFSGLSQVMCCRTNASFGVPD